MANIGDVITRRQIDSSTAALARQGADFRAAGAATGRFSSQHTTPNLTTRSFDLAPVSNGVVDTVARDLAKHVVWADDLNCRPRAALGAALLQQAATGSMLAGANDAFVAGVAVARSHSISLQGWGTHQATVFRSAGHEGLRVLDYVLFDRPVSLTRWTQALGTTPAAVVIESPLLGARGAYATDISQPLIETWTRLPVGYVMRNDLRLPAAGTSTIAGLRRERRAG